MTDLEKEKEEIYRLVKKQVKSMIGREVTDEDIDKAIKKILEENQNIDDEEE